MKRALVAAMLSALATGAVLATVGFGANSTATTSKKQSSKSAQTTQSGPPKTMKQVYDEMQTQRAAQEKKLADALGVSTADLTAAKEKLKKDKLAAEVKANRLTQAQADAITACDAAPLTCDRSNLPAGGPGGRHGGGMKGDRGTHGGRPREGARPRDREGRERAAEHASRAPDAAAACPVAVDHGGHGLAATVAAPAVLPAAASAAASAADPTCGRAMMWPA